ncbi:hypothetical protein DL98DRAFT_652856 [Cadophora sp. DSE1049]|nr:hypothetical protein DL98DRAFT_652856 [Cadophora sp. DSE1049]
MRDSKTPQTASIDRFQLGDHNAAECSAAIRGQAVLLNLGLEITRLCTIRGIRYHAGFGLQLHGLPEYPEFTRALDARRIISNEIPNMGQPEDFPYRLRLLPSTHHAQHNIPPLHPHLSLDLPPGNKGLLILLSAYHGSLDQYSRLQRPIFLPAEQACIVAESTTTPSSQNTGSCNPLLQTKETRISDALSTRGAREEGAGDEGQAARASIVADYREAFVRIWAIPDFALVREAEGSGNRFYEDDVKRRAGEMGVDVETRPRWEGWKEGITRREIGRARSNLQVPMGLTTENVNIDPGRQAWYDCA